MTEMTAILYTTRNYPCGCRAEGPGDVPAYCSEHDKPPRTIDQRIERVCDYCGEAHLKSCAHWDARKCDCKGEPLSSKNEVAWGDDPRRAYDSMVAERDRLRDELCLERLCNDRLRAALQGIIDPAPGTWQADIAREALAGPAVETSSVHCSGCGRDLTISIKNAGIQNLNLMAYHCRCGARTELKQPENGTEGL